MTTYAVTFKLQSDSAYNELSRAQPNAEFSVWCNYSNHVMETSFNQSSSPQSVVQSIRKTARATKAKIVRQVPSSAKTQLFVMTCSCAKHKPTAWSVIAKHNCLDLQPTTYRAGWEWYRILAFRQSDVKSLFDGLSKISKVDVVSQSNKLEFSLRQNFVLSTADLFGDITRKQSEALAVALRLGYYKVPRKISTDDIAKILGRPPTTYREHLRKGESKLLRAVEPYLELGVVR